MEKNKKKYYIELCFSGHIDNEMLANFIEYTRLQAKEIGLESLPSRVKENPNFDSFGNLWE